MKFISTSALFQAARKAQCHWLMLGSVLLSLMVSNVRAQSMWARAYTGIVGNSGPTHSVADYYLDVGGGPATGQFLSGCGVHYLPLSSASTWIQVTPGSTLSGRIWLQNPLGEMCCPIGIGLEWTNSAA